MDAVARFALATRQTAALEARMAATWPEIKAHTPLTHAVTRQQQRLQPQVSALTEQATEMKAMHLRLQNALEQLDATLSGTSKRMFAELVEAAALHERTEMLEDPIQFALDHYELANWRLTEIGAARRGHVLEVLIVVILLADFGVRLLELLIPRVSVLFSTIIP
jgi:chromosome segregation ATPase